MHSPLTGITHYNVRKCNTPLLVPQTVTVLLSSKKNYDRPLTEFAD